MTETPLISCLTVTAGRLILLKQAIQCYIDQTYPRRELVIVTAGTSAYQQAIKRHLHDLDRPDIRLVVVDNPQATLGHLRNVSLDNAHGEVVCQWDDDDLYHPDRVQMQFDAMINADARASYLSDHLQFFVMEQDLYWVNWRHDGILDDSERLMPASLMMYQDPRLRYPEVGKECNVGEDNAIRRQLRRLFSVAELSDHGHLYLYRYHGRNTLNRAHHGNIANFGMRERADFSRLSQRLATALDYYRLPMPYSVKARSGEAILVPHR